MLLALLVYASCTSRIDNEQQVLSELYGSEIQLLDGLTCEIQGTSVRVNPADADYTIICYIDSAGCTPCRMKLPLWDEVVNELSAYDSDVLFVMILGSRRDAKIESNLERESFQHPVCYDSTGLFAASNPLPHGSPYHTLLLDGDSRVVCVGNPVFNPKIRDLYRRVIAGDSASRSKPLSLNATYAVGALHPGDTVSRQFLLANNTDSTLTVQEPVTSCECMTAYASADTLRPGSFMTLSVAMSADTVTGHFVRYVDLFFNEKETPERLTIHGYVTNRQTHAQHKNES